MTEAIVSVLTALGDDELIMGHRHSEWTGFAPHLEEDVAFSSIAQDEIGHAAALYELAASRSGDVSDRLAFGREPSEYRHALLCEQPNGDWAFTLARHWLYDHAESLRLESLAASEDPELAALATKMRREERYHVLHADTWMTRIARGPVEGRTKVVDALAHALPASRGLFEAFEGEAEARARGLLPESSSTLLERFMKMTTESLDELGLPPGVLRSLDEEAEFVASSSGDLIVEGAGGGDGPARRESTWGGRSGRHTEDFTELWQEMTSTYRAVPGATW